MRSMTCGSVPASGARGWLLEGSVKGPSGHSVSRVTEDGRVSMTLQDAQDDEQGDENRVVRTFCQKQRALGFDPVSVGSP